VENARKTRIKANAKANAKSKANARWGNPTNLQKGEIPKSNVIFV